MQTRSHSRTPRAICWSSRGVLRYNPPLSWVRLLVEAPPLWKPPLVEAPPCGSPPCGSPPCESPPPLWKPPPCGSPLCVGPLPRYPLGAKDKYSSNLWCILLYPQCFDCGYKVHTFCCSTGIVCLVSSGASSALYSSWAHCQPSTSCQTSIAAWTARRKWMTCPGTGRALVICRTLTQVWNSKTSLPRMPLTESERRPRCSWRRLGWNWWGPWWHCL